MSDNAWNKIPDDLKDTFVEAVWSGCEQQWQFLNEANEEAKTELEGVGVTFYDIDVDSLKAAYIQQQEKDGTTYDATWVAAVDAAKAAAQ
jgi:TRAP-type C4-dicarboxylate transport system substrate-binding protein